jgi:hypothetical protein
MMPGKATVCAACTRESPAMSDAEYNKQRLIRWGAVGVGIIVLVIVANTEKSPSPPTAAVTGETPPGQSVSRGVEGARFAATIVVYKKRCGPVPSSVQSTADRLEARATEADRAL